MQILVGKMHLAEAEIPTDKEIGMLRKNGRIERNVDETISNQSSRGKLENGCAGLIFLVMGIRRGARGGGHSAAGYEWSSEDSAGLLGLLGSRMQPLLENHTPGALKNGAKGCLQT